MVRDHNDEVGAFSDEPLDDVSGDALGRGPFVARVVALLERVGSHPSSTVAAIVGQWGLGKSSILNAVVTALKAVKRDEREWIVAEFNPWYYQDLASLQTAFFRELSAAIPTGKTWRKRRNWVANLADAVAPLGVFGTLAGVNATGIIQGGADLLRGDRSVLKARAIAERELLKVNRPVLFVIDDLDRLDPQELLLLFKLIRLAGRLPNVYYLLAYDEDTLLDALRRTGLIGDAPRRALDYMEKIVQVRLDVPPLREQQLAEWIDDEIASLARRLDVALDEKARQRFDEAYHGHIRARLRTPRAVKRFFAQVESLAAGVSEEVDFSDFLILSWIRATEPLVYRAIIQHRARLLGEFDLLRKLWTEDQRDMDAEHAFWDGLLEEAGVEWAHREGVAALLGQLFPRFGAQWRKERHGAIGRPDPGRIAHGDYFDRFFVFGVPEGDIADRVVERASEQILADVRGVERDVIEDAWRDRPSLVLSKLSLFWTPDMEAAVPALRWLTAHGTDLSDDANQPGSPRREAVRLAQSLFTELPGEGPVEALTAMADIDPTMRFAEDVLFPLRKSDAPARTRNNAFAAAKAEFARRTGDIIRGYGDTNPLEYPDDVWDLFDAWIATDPDGARSWVTKHLEREDWPLLDLLARMVSRLVPLGVPNPQNLVGELSLTDVDKIIGLGRARNALASEIASYAGDVGHRAPATPENRRAVVLRTLKSARDESE